MSTLEAESKRISESLVILKEELEQQKKDTLELIEVMTVEFKEASAQGDRSENAAFTEAKDKLSMYNSTLSKIDTRLKSMSDKIDESRYQYIGLITLYSTVRLQENGATEYVFKLFPEGVSDIQKGILDVSCPLGKALKLKQLGSVVTIAHRITGEPIKYKILEIY